MGAFGLGNLAQMSTESSLTRNSRYTACGNLHRKCQSECRSAKPSKQSQRATSPDRRGGTTSGARAATHYPPPHPRRPQDACPYRTYLASYRYSGTQWARRQNAGICGAWKQMASMELGAGLVAPRSLRLRPLLQLTRPRAQAYHGPVQSRQRILSPEYTCRARPTAGSWPRVRVRVNEHERALKNGTPFYIYIQYIQPARRLLNEFVIL